MSDSDSKSTNKQICVDLTKKKTTKEVKLEKPKRKRIITDTSKWTDALLESNIDDIENDTSTSPFVLMVHKQVRSKICGYASQDRLKHLFCEEEFVNIQDVLELFKTSELKCYYCKEVTELMYEYVREPKQWTLERLDNSIGHNRGNVFIACLRCNLRRRCMASDKYVKTKEMSKIVKLV